MKPVLTLLLLAASLTAGRAAVITAGDVSGLSTFTTADGLLTLTPNGSNGTFSNSGSFIGVDGGANAGAVDNAETITIALAPSAYLTELRFVWTSPQSDYTLSTLAADPAAIFDPNGMAGETGGVSYAGGALTINIDAWGGTERIVSLGNPAATSGQTLTLQLVDQVNNRQYTLTQIAYVPEPSTLLLGLLGFIPLLRRR